MDSEQDRFSRQTSNASTFHVLLMLSSFPCTCFVSCFVPKHCAPAFDSVDNSDLYEPKRITQLYCSSATVRGASRSFLPNCTELCPAARGDDILIRHQLSLFSSVARRYSPPHGTPATSVAVSHSTWGVRLQQQTPTEPAVPQLQSSQKRGERTSNSNS